MTRTLITGAAGFVGFHLAERLLKKGEQVLGLDNFSSYYDPALKEARVKQLRKYSGFEMIRCDIGNIGELLTAWTSFRPDIVVHLAAQAGVRNSIDNPRDYIHANVIGSFNIFEAARHNPIKHLLVASSSSVYGANQEMPFQETHAVSSPQSLYASSKASAELMGHAYSHLFEIPMTFFRFFTVYGAWGRPDMAYYKFAKSILEGQPIDVYNFGKNSRDFTYIDDLIEAIDRLIDVVPGATPPVAGDTLSTIAPHRVVNIGQSNPIGLMDFIAAIEAAVGKRAELRMLPAQPGDVDSTYASTELLQSLTGYVPDTPLDVGVRRFVEWYRDRTSAAIVEHVGRN